MRIIYFYPKNMRDARSKTAAKVVPDWVSFDEPTEQLHSCAENHLDLIVLRQHGLEEVYGIERGGQVCIPKPDEVRRRLKGLMKPPAHSLSLPRIPS